MDGDIAPIPEILEIVRESGAFLFVDEAHSVGVLGRHGRGVAEYFDLDPRMIDIRTGSLNKAIPAAGGFVVADASIVRLLRYGSAGATFSGALAPPSVLSAHASIDVLESEPERLFSLHRNAEHFRTALKKEGVESMGGATPIVPILIGNRDATLSAGRALLERGVHLNAIVWPGVRPGKERLRCFVTADHSKADLDFASTEIAKVLRSHA
jgi:7-keto-8-aminopelargonate synthetase-like enzyme